MKTNKFLIPTISLLVILVGVILWRENTKTNNSTSSPSPSMQAPVIEEVESGVYTNYTYGFRFEYPDKIFNTSNPWEINMGKQFMVDGDFFPRLRVQSLGQEWNETLNKCIEAKEGEIISQDTKSGTRVKLYNTDISCVVSFDPRGFKDGEPPYGFSTYFHKDGQIVLVSLSSSKDSKNQYASVIDKIVQSFEFFAPID